MSDGDASSATASGAVGSSSGRLVVHLDVPGGAVDLTAEAGEVRLLPGGAEVIAALTTAERERAHRLVLDGRRLEGAGRARRVRAGLIVLDPPEFAGDVSVRDHLAAVVRPAHADQLLAQVPQLTARRKEPAGVLSGGERRLLGWLAAIALRPQCVVLDRAGTGLDVHSLAWAHGVIDGWLARGTVVLIRPGRVEETAWAATTADGKPR